jgi:hypothetical protein
MLCSEDLGTPDTAASQVVAHISRYFLGQKSIRPVAAKAKRAQRTSTRDNVNCLASTRAEVYPNREGTVRGAAGVIHYLCWAVEPS